MSYRTFCTTIGPGTIAGNFDIAAPVQKATTSVYSLAAVDDLAHNGLEPETYSKDLEQHRRGLFFSLDGAGNYHFFDPAEVTDISLNEYAVYSLLDDYHVQRMAENFWEFVADVCLGSRCGFFMNPPAPQTFMPVSLK